MPRYPAVPLEQKLAWMRERQREKDAEVRRRESERLQAMGINEQQAVRPPESNGTVVAERPRHRMMHVDQVADILQMSAKTVRRWFRDRAVVVRAGRRKTTMLISEQILDDWIAEHTGHPKKRRARG